MRLRGLFQGEVGGKECRREPALIAMPTHLLLHLCLLRCGLVSVITWPGVAALAVC